MPVFLNENDHQVTATDDKGRVVRIPAGRAATVDGPAADTFKGYGEEQGVRELSGDEGKKALDAQRQARGASDVVTAEGALPQRTADMVAALGQLTVAAPLQVVVGDDQAPYGPPSGEVSTKVEQAQRDQAHREHFADHEALPGEAVEGVEPATALHGIGDPPTSAAVHNAQVENTERAEELTRDAGLVGSVEDRAAKQEGQREQTSAGRARRRGKQGDSEG